MSLMLMHIPFNLSKCVLLCWLEFKLLMSVAMLLQCALQLADVIGGRTRLSTLKFFHKQSKDSFYGSSCNPSSGIFFSVFAV